MRRIVPEVEDLHLDELYRGLTLTAGAGDGPDRRSWIALGVVTSIDGSATVGGRSAGLGGEPDRIAFSRLRAACDAIMVGAGTVRAEGYRPLTGGEARRTDRQARGLAPAPRLVVVTRSLQLPVDHAIFSAPDERPLVVTHASHPPGDVAPYREVADVLELGQEEVDLCATVRELAVMGLPRVVCEGGPQLAGSLHDLDLIDEVFVTLAAAVVGGQAPRIVAGAVEQLRTMRLVSVHEHDGELLLRYRRHGAGRTQQSPGADDRHR